jgi:hypothetical protein
VNEVPARQERSLLALSHTMERALDVGRVGPHDGPPPLIVALFQRPAYF